MIVLGFDTATQATAVGLRLGDGTVLQARDDPGPQDHPGHATELLAMAAGLLGQAGIGWGEIELIAVGVGPGRFTGLRVGIATGRGLAQSLDAELVGVSSLAALAAPAREREGRVLAVIDARRGEVFAAAYAEGRELNCPHALQPEDMLSILAQPASSSLAVGDGAVRYRDRLEAGGVTVPADSSLLHQVSGEAICEIAVSRARDSIDAVLPDYRRRPDAEIALERKLASSSVAV